MRFQAIINIFLLLVFLSLFFLVEQGMSSALIWGCLLVYYYYFILSLSKPVTIVPGLPSYLKPDLLFLMFYYMIFFLPYQLHVLGMADLDDNSYLKHVYIEYANISIVASTIGLIAFCTGFQKDFKFLYFKDKPQELSELFYFRYLPVLVLCFLLFFLSIYTFTGAKAMLTGAYATSDVGSRAENGVFILVSHFLMLCLAISVFFIREKQWVIATKLSVGLGILWCLLLLIVGDRNTFFIVALVPLVGFATYIRKVSLLNMAALILCAFFLYGVVEVSRQAPERGFSAIVEALAEGGKSESFDQSSFSITTITSRAAFEIVPHKHDYFMGKFKAIGIAGIVPFSRGVLISPSDPYTTSSKVLGEEVLGPMATWGVGSNIVSDIYLDFGIFGVVVLMYFIGWFGAFVQAKAIENNNSIKWGSIYLILVPFYAEYPRYSFDFPVRNIAWAFMLFALYALIFRRVEYGEKR